MTIVKFIANASKKHAKVGSGKLPSKGNSPAAPPAPPVDEGKVEAKPVLEEKVEEEKVEDGRLERVVEEAPIQPKKAEDDVPPPKPAGKRKALLIGIQFYPVPEPAEPQDLPTSDAATRATPSLDASSYLTSITSRAKAKFMQMCSIGSPLASESALPSSSFSPAPPPPLVGTRKKSYAAAVSPRAGLSPAPSAWPALSSAAPVTSPITPVTPKTAAGGIMTSPTRVPLKPGRSAALQQQKSLTEKTAKKKREKEKKQEKKKEKSGQTKERSASSAWSFARKGCHRDVDEMEKMLVGA
ncbi:hypothetical protein BKA70DRAFT_271242 [Coprinopsis sp. MPI-PUGE-AT-0042]|nr:hypothetical protein BKA70DRAFT_271242 [Coprinopsis sp. MPI-PUGE-AT-0042]